MTPIWVLVINTKYQSSDAIAIFCMTFILELVYIAKYQNFAVISVFLRNFYLTIYPIIDSAFVM